MAITKKTLSIDIETFSTVDLSKAGVYKYADDPSFEIMLLAYAWDDEPVHVIDMTERTMPREVIEAIMDPEVVKTAWNANFERTCLRAATGAPMPPEQWDDTMIRAAQLGQPMTLAAAGLVLGLPEDKRKMQEGRNLIQYFAKPCRPSKTNGFRTRNLPEHAPEKWALYQEYNARDVETEREIRRRLLRHEIDPREHGLWVIDQDINDRGVLLDRTFAENAEAIDTRIKDQLKAEAKMISGLDNPNSVAQIKKWIKEETGQEVESLDKRAIKDVMERLQDHPEIIRFLQIRGLLSMTSTAKYSRMLQCANTDDRIRGLSQYYGASRTGRWAGRLVQMQNLKQNKMPDEDLDTARRIVRDADVDTLSLLYEPAQALSELIRTSFIPRPGCKFVVSDFSAIEARVLAWLAGEEWRLDVFKGDGKIYEASAEKMFNLPPGSVKKGDPMRQKGKIAELALGYGGSVGALKAMGALEMGLQENELKPLVDSWRAANRQITKLWWDVDKKAKTCVRYGAKNTKPGGGWSTGRTYKVYRENRLIEERRAVSAEQAKSHARYAEDRLFEDWDAYTAVLVNPAENLRMRMDGPLLRILLPSGREISYTKPKVSAAGDLTYEGQIQAGGWGRIETYGPKLVENIIQAISRDCLAESMRRLAAEKIPVVFHVHDEVICEVPEDGPGAEEIAQIMGEPIDWAPGLPMKADAYECLYYRKD